MSKKRLPKAVFEAGSVAVARIHLASSKPLPLIATSIWSEYEAQCEDPTAAEEMTTAARSLLDGIEDKKMPEPQHLLRHLQYFCQAFEDDGRPRRKFLNGLWFRKENYDPRRSEVFIRKAKVYCAALQSGLVPLAPTGYQCN